MIGNYKNPLDRQHSVLRLHHVTKKWRKEIRTTKQWTRIVSSFVNASVSDGHWSLVRPATADAD